MTLGGVALAGVPLGSLHADSGSSADPLADAPMMLEVNHTDWRDWFQVETLSITDTLGQPMTCEYTLVNPTTRPKPGDLVRVKYYSEVLFAGVLVIVEHQPATDHAVLAYRCSASDWSVILTRRKMRRNFTNLPLANIVDSIIDNELSGEGLTIGTIQQGATIPLVDVKNGRVFDVLRDVAATTGQSMYVDDLKRIHFTTSSGAIAPKYITDETVEASSLSEDVETYRNVQTVIVTGTPDPNEEAGTAVVVRENAEQIETRRSIEGGSGRYEEIEEVTHPTSNAGAELALLGIGYARLRLATSGVPRKTLRAKVRGYGLRAGQYATVYLTGTGVTGDWLIQRAELREVGKKYLYYQLELTQSSRQYRAYEAWLNIVKTGKITVQMPGAVTANSQVYDTPGSYTWTVPAGITTVEVTCIGASAGGSGSAKDGKSGELADQFTVAHGAEGGDSGLATSILSVVPGQELTVIVGAAGLPGVDAYRQRADNDVPPTTILEGTAGTAGGASQVLLAGAIVCQGNGGEPGEGGQAAFMLPGEVPFAYPLTGLVLINGVKHSDASGIGDAVTVGGGYRGGVGGDIGLGIAVAGGQDGQVEILW